MMCQVQGNILWETTVVTLLPIMSKQFLALHICTSYVLVV